MRPTEQMSRNETITEERGLIDFSSQQFGQHCGSLRMPDQDKSAPFGSIRDVMPERIENIRVSDFKTSCTGATNEVIFRNLDQAGNSWHWSLSIHRCVHITDFAIARNLIPCGGQLTFWIGGQVTVGGHVVTCSGVDVKTINQCIRIGFSGNYFGSSVGVNDCCCSFAFTNVVNIWQTQPNFRIAVNSACVVLVQSVPGLSLDRARGYRGSYQRGSSGLLDCG